VEVVMGDNKAVAAERYLASWFQRRAVARQAIG
jgi:hypothetical protein